MDKNLRKLAANKLLQLHAANKEHEKRAHALKLIYKQAEMGYGEFPRSFSDLQEKVASLLNQDLQVVEKALELTGGTLKLGELGSVDTTMHTNAEEEFQAKIVGEL